MYILLSHRRGWLDRGRGLNLYTWYVSTARSIIFAWYLVPWYQLLVLRKQQQVQNSSTPTKSVRTTTTTTTKSQVRRLKAHQTRIFLEGLVLVRGAAISHLSWGRFFLLFIVPCFLLVSTFSPQEQQLYHLLPGNAL